MKLRALKYFQTVAECGSFSRGSELLRISQPAVSRTILDLEEELQCKLFTRGSGGVILTEQGRILLSRSQLVLHEVERIKQDIIGGIGGPSGIVTIAIPPAVGHLLVPPLAHLLNDTAPNISLKVLGGFSSYIKELLVKGQVDLACTHDPVLQRGFSVLPMLEEEVFIVGKSGSFGTDSKFISPTILAQLPLVLPARPNSSRRFLDRWAEPAGLQLDPKVEVDDHMITRGLLEAGVGFAPLTKGAINRELAAGTVEARPLQPRAYWPLTLMTCISQSRSEAVDHVAEALQKIVAERLKSGTWAGVRSNNDQVTRKT